MGGLIILNYADEEYVDLSTEEYERYFNAYKTKRISSIESEFGRISFMAEQRNDRGGIGNRSITRGFESKRINKIEMRDENGDFVKGFELDNSGCFGNWPEYQHNEWCNFRHKLSSITQYDSLDNHLPPYEFQYSHKFSSSKLANPVSQYTDNYGNELPRNSWTSCIGGHAYVDLNISGDPSCYMRYPNTPYTELVGITIQTENSAPTAGDYFCLTKIKYPTDAIEEFYYENHRYRKVNEVVSSGYRADKIQGKRLVRKFLYGSEIEQQVEYVYLNHDADYNTMITSSGVLTNPSIHYATLYSIGGVSPETAYTASRITSGKAFNSYMGSPICYTEVEEVEKDMDNNIIGRTIHYYNPRKVIPPVNYIFFETFTNTLRPNLIEVDNHIYGAKTGYMGNMSYCNTENMTYMAYPVGEFCEVGFNAEQPIKEVFIGKDGTVKRIKEYTYRMGDEIKKYGYKIVSKPHYQFGNPDNDYTLHLISMTEYQTQRLRNNGYFTTTYFCDENGRCDSICEDYGESFNKGRVYMTTNVRNGMFNQIRHYFPDDIVCTMSDGVAPEIISINKLIEKNMIAAPVKTVTKRDNLVVGGECKDYQMLDDIPLLKSLYKIKQTAGNYDSAPRTSGNGVDYRAELYKDGEILLYDENLNPVYVRTNGDQDKIYVWGYDGRFPVAIIENMDYDTFNANSNLIYILSGLTRYRKIDSETECQSLKTTNTVIRLLVPQDAHITTFTYDPYYGITSEIDDSNIGTIYTYDTFGRLSAKYDENYKKIEEYDYHLRLQ